MTTRVDLTALRKALDEFEEAVKTHEHHTPLTSEVVQRQEVDRTRQTVFDVVSEILGDR